MPERYPATLDEFWERLEHRKLEPGLRAELQRRTAAWNGSVSRLGRGATVVAFVEALLPGSQVPAETLAGFVDANFDRQLGRGDEREGMLPRAELIPAGFAALDAAVEGGFGGLGAGDRERVLKEAEEGALPGAPGFDSGVWFRRVRDLVLLGFASDPRGMMQMGYPGPSYEPGYAWLGWGGAEARRARRPGYRSL